MKSQINELAIIVPAYNEEESINAVLKKTSLFGKVFLVDDASTDNTVALALKNDIEIIKHHKNMGYEEAIKTGLMAAINRNFKYAITFDADGQHLAEDIPRFLHELELGADLVIGSRARLQRWSEVVSSIISKTFWGIDDLLCGMKGYKLSKVNLISKINTYKSGGSELSIRLIKMGVTTSQIRINTNKRDSQSRYGDGIKVNLNILWSTLRGIFL
jgi:glycosyltransferase involved in cell wall biosynthesis